MAYDPNSLAVHTAADTSIPEGHYALRANDYDGRAEDSVVIAQREAFEASARLDLSADGRTPEEIDRVDELSRRAHALASDANVALLRGHIPEAY